MVVGLEGGMGIQEAWAGPHIRLSYVNPRVRQILRSVGIEKGKGRGSCSRRILSAGAPALLELGCTTLPVRGCVHQPENSFNRIV